MIKKDAIQAARAAYDIEAACITEMKEFVDDEQFAKAIELLSTAERIGTCGSMALANCSSSTDSFISVMQAASMS